MSPKLDLVVLWVADVDASAAFYRALGLTPNEEQHAGGPRHFAMELGSVVLELYPRAQRPSTNVRLGLVVPDVATAMEAAERVGGRSLRAGVLEDPDGNVVVLREL